MECFDDIIIGAGHNGLTAAAYLARAGRRVLVLERADHVGGATVSATPFPGVPAHLSRYSYLVSLLPREIITDLDLDISLIRRRYSSYTPLPTDPTRGLLVDNADESATAESFRRITGDDTEFASWRWFYGRMGEIARRVFPTLIEPLRSRDELRDRVTGASSSADLDTSLAEIWELLTERPLGELIERYFADDLVRGVVATDALIGTFADLHDARLRQNICFLYHLIGGGTGDWDVPVGGMGAVSGALYEAAVAAGARIVTGARITGIDPADGTVEYVYSPLVEPAASAASSRVETTLRASMLYVACAPQSINDCLDVPLDVESDTAGAQLKINLLLDRLPALRDGSVLPDAAFSGTFHINESYGQLHAAWQQASIDKVPSVPPCEIYCHTLSDRSILGPELAGCHTLTLFGLQMPPAVFDAPSATGRAVEATLSSLNSVLAEPIQSVVCTDAHGNPCIEAKTPQDLEAALGLPGGNIFHRSLQWPWAQDQHTVGQWGVETRHPRVLLAGAAARRGGGVSGIPGHNAAALVLGG
ncbi:NAD(P)/FAD-dependent oxidoreductase [Gordonia sputi]|uniref:phytoene desaturase family protein n=1 Tax=Gordonia sputi TaxID=36823 RepID=UPI002042D465|nr:NAD(P)/FAD-dependent oxidoreductase [Gordonia sputi]MCM3894255.1 NAD(P)/FAD-dependent oxidoreductase [Gordonia sputi]